ncbi:MAG: hypothetical protein NT150_11760 [Bacteroidetes bacterium]|nr:hypothetical protein [Bacteroidota bacterium]
MTEQEKHLQDLKEIRSLMEKSSKFISLSGLSGIITGVVALAGAVLAYSRLQAYWMRSDSGRFNEYSSFIHTAIPERMGWSNLVFELVLIACGVLAISVGVSVYLTVKQAKKNGQSIWDKSSQMLLINMMIPLVSGGVFALILIKQDLFGLVAPVTLIFYGLALINASKYTLHDIRYLGIAQLVLGLMNAASIGYGLFYWGIGFGVFHIIYGTVMYLKYERKS